MTSPVGQPFRIFSSDTEYVVQVFIDGNPIGVPATFRTLPDSDALRDENIILVVFLIFLLHLVPVRTKTHYTELAQVCQRTQRYLISTPMRSIFRS